MRSIVKNKGLDGMVACTFNSSMLEAEAEAEAGRLLSSRPPQLHSNAQLCRKLIHTKQDTAAANLFRIRNTEKLGVYVKELVLPV